MLQPADSMTDGHTFCLCFPEHAGDDEIEERANKLQRILICKACLHLMGSSDPQKLNPGRNKSQTHC